MMHYLGELIMISLNKEPASVDKLPEYAPIEVQTVDNANNSFGEIQLNLTKEKISDSNYIDSYISNTFEYFHQSEASYTLNILEIILNLHINNKPSISLIDDTLPN
eukprot:66448_1